MLPPCRAVAETNLEQDAAPATTVCCILVQRLHPCWAMMAGQKLTRLEARQPAIDHALARCVTVTNNVVTRMDATFREQTQTTQSCRQSTVWRHPSDRVDNRYKSKARIHTKHNGPSCAREFLQAVNAFPVGNPCRSRIRHLSHAACIQIHAQDALNHGQRRTKQCPASRVNRKKA